MKVKSALVTQMSGSIGGLTGSHNASGLYLRARTIPVNTNTAYQQAVRAYMASLVAAWVNSLTQSQRDAWDAYAAAVTLTNPLGDPINVSGLNMYVRSNIPRRQSSLTDVDDGPTVYTLAEGTEPSYAAPSEASQDVDVTFDTDDDWVDEDEAGMLIFASRPQNPSINYFKGPYRFAGLIAGDSVTPPTSPATINMPFPFVAGQKLFFKATIARADGRYSSPFRATATGAA
jgi:hypothetical protein